MKRSKSSEFINDRYPTIEYPTSPKISQFTLRDT